MNLTRTLLTLIVGTVVFALLGASTAAANDSLHPNQSPVRQIVLADSLDLPLLGTLKTKTTKEIESNPWSIGCETLGRGFADFDQYKDYLPALGAKSARIQSGWARCEKEPGVYDFQWLDHIIDGLNERGVSPWVTVCYGNPIYEGGGTISLGGGMPYSDQGLAAWDAYVKALVTRYKGKVQAWEIWNEPDLGFHGSGSPLPARYADLLVRSARIIKSIDPDAEVWAFSIAGNTAFVDQALPLIKERGGLDLIDEVTYHGYRPRPEDQRGLRQSLQAILAKHGLDVPIRQGENGCPSHYMTKFALAGHPWTELSQAKWFLRRMTEDCRAGVPTNIFTIVDLNYRNSAHTSQALVHNPKGLLASDKDDRVLYPKLSYFAVMNLITLTSDSVKPAPVTAEDVSGEGIEVAGFAGGAGPVVLVWDGSGRPSDRLARTAVSMTLKDTELKNPVLVDIVSGKVYELAEGSVSVIDGSTQLTDLPVWDAPIALVPRGAIEIAP